jgi:hypothetical protein
MCMAAAGGVGYEWRLETAGCEGGGESSEVNLRSVNQGLKKARQKRITTIIYLGGARVPCWPPRREAVEAGVLRRWGIDHVAQLTWITYIGAVLHPSAAAALPTPARVRGSAITCPAFSRRTGSERATRAACGNNGGVDKP